MKPFAEVVETLGGQGVVVVLPRELSLDIAAGGERLASLDNEQVLGVDIGVLGEVEVLLGDEDTLSEEVLPVSQFLVIRIVRQSIATSWIFFRSALGINIVAVLLVEGRCWKMSVFSVRGKGQKWITICGRKPYKFHLAKCDGPCVTVQLVASARLLDPIPRDDKIAHLHHAWLRPQP